MLAKSRLLAIFMLVLAILTACDVTLPTVTPSPTVLPTVANTPEKLPTVLPTPQPTEIPTCVTALVALNLRRDADPSSDSNIIARLMKGVRVEVIYRVEDWSYVQTKGGLQGWVRSKYLGACD